MVIQNCGKFVREKDFQTASSRNLQFFSMTLPSHKALQKMYFSSVSLLPKAGLELCGFKRKCVPNSNITDCFYSQTEYSNSTVLNHEYKPHCPTLAMK